MVDSQPQRELGEPSPLLDDEGNLIQVGWARQPLLDCNLEAARFYALRSLQRFRIKRWDYYGLTTPTHFYSFTLADLGYAGQAFAYVVDLEAGTYHEQTLTLPLARGITLPRNSTEGVSAFKGNKAGSTTQDHTLTVPSGENQVRPPAPRCLTSRAGIT